MAAALARGWRSHGPFPAGGGRRWRCRPHPITLLLAFAFRDRGPVPAPSSQSQSGEEPGKPPARSPRRDLRFVKRLPTDGSRLPSTTPRGGTGAPGCQVEPVQRPGRPQAATRASLQAPARTRPHHGHGTTGVEPGDGQRPSPAHLLDPAATYSTTLTASAGLLAVAPDRQRCCVTCQAEFAPAHQIAGGSGGRSQRSLP